MKTYYFLLLALFLVNTGDAQNSSLDYRMAIKLYNQTSFEKSTNVYVNTDTTSNFYRDTEEDLKLIHPSLAFQWKSGKNNFHEIELGNVRVGQYLTKIEEIDEPMNNGQIVQGVNVKTSSFALRYEYILNFNKKAETKLVPSLGFGAGTYFMREKREPLIPQSFPTAQTEMGIKLYITPRFVYYFNSKLFLDINLPFCLSDMNVSVFSVKNPAYTPIQQRNSTYTFSTFPKIFSGRIGIGLKI